jgi:hypothetical protein
MNLNYYIIDFFIQELNLDENSPVVGKLKSIRNGIYLFLTVHAITSFYAFNSIFGNIFVALLAAIIYVFIFLVVYIVLLATVRKVDFQKQERNVKIKAFEKINDVDYSVTKFGKLQPTFIGRINKKGWGNIIFRSTIILFLGIGPAFFAGTMVHHLLTNNYYESAKQTFINDQIQIHYELISYDNILNQKKLDSLKHIRQNLVSIIDSLESNPDSYGYYKKDIAWYQSRLENFDILNAPKITRYSNKIASDSISDINYINKIENHYKNANFFNLRSSVTWKYYGFTYILVVLIYLLILYMPFFVRYRLMMKYSHDLDDKLEAHYVNIITRNFERHVEQMKHSNVVEELKKFLTDEQLAEKKKIKFIEVLDYFNRMGHNYFDPAIKAKDNADTRIFIDKGGLGKYLGKQ